VATPPDDVTVLVVDDDEPTQNLLRAVLRRCGYASEMASNGAQAIARLQAKRYAAVILDMMMPEVGGRTVVEFLSATPNPVPVIICSAAGLSALTGFDPAVVKAIVRKPFDIEHLVAAITGVALTSGG
jgi:two-component system response regulator ResD